MTVYDLTRDQLDELKESLFYQFLDDDDEQPFAIIDPILKKIAPDLLNADFPDEIPDNVIFQVYDGINFVNDDFFCTFGK
jgi:hypothetical protein